MYYRISTFRGKPGMKDALMAKADTMKDQMRAVPGLKSIEVVELGEDDYMNLAGYDSKENAEAAIETAKAIFGALAECIELDTLEFSGGDVIWTL